MSALAGILLPLGFGAAVAATLLGANWAIAKLESRRGPPRRAAGPLFAETPPQA